MGEFLREYKPPRISLNATLNYFLTKTVKIATTAVITQEVMFPDVSFYQGDIDYEIMGTKTKAIILRVGQGKWKDDKFERNYREAKRKGLLVGVYWFYDGRYSPSEQAQVALLALEGKQIELGFFMDWEHNYGGAHEGLRNVVAMMELIQTKYTVGLYTGYFFFRSNSNPITNASQYNYLKTKPLWLGWYTNNSVNVLIPAPWTDLTFWQFGTPVIHWGQETLEIDMNFFNGTRREFEHIYVTSGELPMSETYIKLESNTTVSRSIREQTTYPRPPHILGAWKGRIEAGRFGKAEPTAFYRYSEDIIISGEVFAREGDIWWKVYEANGQPIDGWVAEIHKGEVLLTRTTIGDDPIPDPDPPVLPDLPVSITLGDDVTYIKQTINIVLKPK